ncbi:MAG: peptidylprolyl isomerase [Bacteroidia bacterium]|nr:peptidylprolyl isomerase [Bacteroidia bacterium]
MIRWIAGLLFVALSMAGVHQVFGQNEKVIDQVVAVVGNKIILISDIEAQYHQLKEQGYISQGDPKCEILEEMLFQKLLLNQATLDSLEVTDNQVESALENRLKMFVNQAGSEQKLEEYFNKSILDIKTDLKEIIRDQMLTQKMQGKITDDIKVTPSDIRQYYNRIPKDSLPLIAAEYQIGQIVKYPVITESEKLEVKEKLQNFRDQVIAGKKKFSTLAFMYSEDKESAKNNGDLGFVGRTDLVPEFAAAAFRLREKDEVSNVIETQYGYHIIQLIERKGEKVDVRHILLTPKPSPESINKASNFLDSIATVIRTGKIAFDEAAQKFSEDEKTRNNGGLVVNEESGNSKLTADEIDKVTNIHLKNLKVGEISPAFELKEMKGRISYRIIRLKNLIPPHTSNLTDDYQRIQDNALAEKKQKAVDEWVSKKLQSTYVHVDDSYHNCSFKNKKWLK